MVKFRVGDLVEFISEKETIYMKKSGIFNGAIGKVVTLDNYLFSKGFIAYLVEFKNDEGDRKMKICYEEELKMKAPKLKAYLAGPFFSDKQIEIIKGVEDALEKNENIESFFSPRLNQHEDMEMFTPTWAKKVAMNDYKEVRNADVIVAIVDFDGKDCDSGTGAEIGYAYAKDIPIILVNINQHEDMVNLMLTEVAQAYITSFDQLAKYDFKEKIPFNGSYR